MTRAVSNSGPNRMESRGLIQPRLFSRPRTTTTRFCILRQGVDNPDQAYLRPGTVPVCECMNASAEKNPYRQFGA